MQRLPEMKDGKKREDQNRNRPDNIRKYAENGIIRFGMVAEYGRFFYSKNGLRKLPQA